MSLPLSSVTPAYWALFVEFPYPDSDGSYHQPTTNLACNNGHWVGEDRPLVPASGWFADAALVCASSAEEDARMRVLTAYTACYVGGWYSYRLLANPDHPWGDGGPTVLLFDGDKLPDGAHQLSWWPFGGW